MSTTPWHLDHQLAERYADGALGDVLTASVEQHLLGCPACRALLAPHVDTPRLDAVWAEILDEVERPRPTLLERCLHGLGVGDATARLVAATPPLRGAWLAGSVLVLVLALVSAYADPRGVAVYLAVAPLLPVVGVALVYGPRADPAHEIVAAAPHPQLRLLAL
ncbi:MAG: zf-HC2 domain-containing protein, partial [Nocardioides sp.]